MVTMGGSVSRREPLCPVQIPGKSQLWERPAAGRVRVLSMTQRKTPSPPASTLTPALSQREREKIDTNWDSQHGFVSHKN
jgi:hypothetical protein